MIEKYLKDSIPEPDRKAKIETISKLNLMPPRIVAQLRERDSITHAKNAKYLLEKGYLKSIKDTMGLEDEDNQDALDELNRKPDTETKTDTTPQKKPVTKKDSINAVLPDKIKPKIKK
jgi:penicillin-binding protein 2